MKTNKLKVLIKKIIGYSQTKKTLIKEANLKLIEILKLKSLVKEVKKQGGTVLIITNTKIKKEQVKHIITIPEKWVGGLLTNWTQYQKYFKTIKSIKKDNQNIENLKNKFFIKKKPSLVILVNRKENHLVSNECKIENVPLFEITQEKEKRQKSEEYTYWIKTDKSCKSQYIISSILQKIIK